ncbi:hypothetical protein K439DRAFT_1328428, partial [Ramaria rubella]
QISIIPVFAYTAYNPQGRSLNNTCVNITSCPSVACAYVMPSCICSLEDLSILQSFTFDKISKHAPEEMHNELKHLDLLYEKKKKLPKKT